jgi:hypothetical protein
MVGLLTALPDSRLPEELHLVTAFLIASIATDGDSSPTTQMTTPRIHIYIRASIRSMIALMYFILNSPK